MPLRSINTSFILAFARKVISGVLGFIFLTTIMANAQTPGTQTQQVTPDGVKYWLYVPPGYNASSTYPLLIYLHGGGDINTNYDLNQLTGDTPYPYTTPHTAPPWLIRHGQWPTNRDFIVVSPLLARDTDVPNYNDQEWPMTLVDNLVEYLKITYKVNPNKIYFTGMSLGGAACWNYAGTHPDKVAAIVPFSGNTILSQGCTLADNKIPVWVFHGTEDLLVSPVQSTGMVTKINSCPGVTYKAQLNMLFGPAHAGWNQVYDGTDGYDIFTWMHQFSKGDTDNKKPFVSAGQDMQIVRRSTSLHLAGEYFDPEGSIASVQWSQIGGSPALTLSNTNGKFLQINGLVEGTFTFRLTVTDVGSPANTVFDDVTIQILPTTFSGAAVTGISLYNNNTDALITGLSEGIIINKNTLGVSSYTLKATISNNGGSVWYSVNSDQRVYQDGNFISNPGPYRLIGLSLPVGDYNVCATSFTGAYGNGTQAASLCYMVSVYNQPVKTLYPKPGTDISVLSNWGTVSGGTGTAPTSFTDNFQNFYIDKAVVLNGALTFGGVQSAFYVKNGGQLTINNAVNATINTEGNAVVNVNTAQPVTFGTLATTSTVNFGAGVVSIPGATYGNLILSGPGALASNTTTVAGTLTIADNATVQGNSDNSSVLAVAGDININEDAQFNPAIKFGLQFTGTSQSLNVKSTKVSFSQITIPASDIVELKTPSVPTTLEVGIASGGGLAVSGNFMLHNHNLLVSQAGSLNGAGQTGTLAVSGGSITINSSAGSGSNVYLASGSNTLQSLSVDQSGGAVNIQAPALITDFVKSKNGTIHSNGNLSLVSTATQTARIEPVEGVIEGAVEFQRYIDGTELYKYISIPVSTVAVSDFQSYVPVAGKFSGASSAGAASLYYYNEPAGGWTQFPKSSNTELFSIGKGYSVFMLPGAQSTVKVKGPIAQGNFTFQLTGDPNTSVNNDGWNLIGNPYASPIRWGGSGWDITGVNTTAYVRANSAGGGGFKMWDGSTGDPEFSGLVAQGQSIWVRATSASPQLTIHESAKVSVGNAKHFREDQDVLPDNRLIIELKKDDLVDRTYLKFTAGATDKFDTQIDGIKMKNDYFNLSSLSTDSVSLGINNLSDTSCAKRINLVIATPDKGSYSFNFQGSLLDNSVREISLIDNYLNSKTTLMKDTPYNFTVNMEAKSSGNKRFQIEMKTSGAVPVISGTGNVLRSSFPQDNQWLLNGEEIKGATGSTYETFESGQYQVRVTDGNCTIVSDNFTTSVTGVNENVAIHDVRIYPNPANEIFYVQGWSKDQSDIRYSIVNIYGMEVQQGEFSAGDFREGKDIQLTDAIHSGIYFLRLESQGLNYTSKLVIE